MEEATHRWHFPTCSPGTNHRANVPLIYEEGSRDGTFELVGTDSPSGAPILEDVETLLKGFRYGKRGLASRPVAPIMAATLSARSVSLLSFVLLPCVLCSAIPFYARTLPARPGTLVVEVTGPPGPLKASVTGDPALCREGLPLTVSRIKGDTSRIMTREEPLTPGVYYTCVDAGGGWIHLGEAGVLYFDVESFSGGVTRYLGLSSHALCSSIRNGFGRSPSSMSRPKHIGLD
ncbi:hypothetical protein AAG570_003064 [Ranatra chinensis]|uniref:Uncharacterized protein n=1 Tax=Ranatra chinensis TaxID=642074 RepID=A0ABD0YJZ8_9HEMI